MRCTGDSACVGAAANLPVMWVPFRKKTSSNGLGTFGVQQLAKISLVRPAAPRPYRGEGDPVGMWHKTLDWAELITRRNAGLPAGRCGGWRVYCACADLQSLQSCFRHRWEW
ncbi:hypothetical protein J6590_051106 [Homalodisca vitripennis]|nr:hypothetical protein J6590_051106 [Homalodisca vitripennis]